MYCFTSTIPLQLFTGALTEFNTTVWPTFLYLGFILIGDGSLCLGYSIDHNTWQTLIYRELHTCIWKVYG